MSEPLPIPDPTPLQWLSLAVKQPYLKLWRFANAGYLGDVIEVTVPPLPQKIKAVSRQAVLNYFGEIPAERVAFAHAAWRPFIKSSSFNPGGPGAEDGAVE